MTNIYPLNLLNVDIHPIFDDVKGLPMYIPLSKDNSFIRNATENDTPFTQEQLNEYIQSQLKKNNRSWAISNYLENRTEMLSISRPDMVLENRTYNIGVNITAPLGSVLHSPLDAEVVQSYYEVGEGNYGGLVVLKHNINGCIFYSLYGHLNKNHLPKTGITLKQGEVFEEVGNFDDNGHWFLNVHLQILTEEAYNSGWISKGYCKTENLPNINSYCPNPLFLLKI